jgi:hypothetical protein
MICSVAIFVIYNTLENVPEKIRKYECTHFDNPPRETNSRSSGQEIPRLLWN